MFAPEVMLEGVRSPEGGVGGSAIGNDVLIGELLVGGMDTAFRRYFPPLKCRAYSDRSSDLRGFVRTLLYNDEGLANLAEGGEAEIGRLVEALKALDTYRTESSHYSWEDFLTMLGRELGDRASGGEGAVYENGRGFVVPGEDHGTSLQQRMLLIDQAGRKLDAILHAEGGSREDFLRQLQKTNPREYQGVDALSGLAADVTSSTTSRGIGEAPSAMDVDDGAYDRGMAEAGLRAATGYEAALRSTNDKIAAVEQQLAALKMAKKATPTSASATPPLQRLALLDAGAVTAPPSLLQQPSARGMSEAQASEGVERRMDAKESQAAAAQKEKDGAGVHAFLRKGPLLQEQEREVDRVFDGGPDTEVLVKAFNASLTRRDLKCLQPFTWLNDEVVNMYMQLLMCRDEELCKADPNRRRSYFFSSFFYAKLKGNECKYNYRGVKRWTRKVNVFEMDKIFVPVNVSNAHWCMAVVNVQKKRINYYDSMGGGGRSVMDDLLLWLEDEDDDKNGGDATFDPDDWTTVGTRVATTPQQENGSDCGAFAVSFASYLSDDLPFDFGQADISQMRRRMLWSLLKQRLV